MSNDLNEKPEQGTPTDPIAVTGDQADCEAKRQAIRDACQDRDLRELIGLASSAGGLLDDDLRRSAWPLLLSCDANQREEKGGTRPWQDLSPHDDEEQVQKDVDRAFVYYPDRDSPGMMDARKKQLFELIVGTLRTHRLLCYFQGYHDIVQVFLLVLGQEAAAPAVASISLLRIRDYMLPSLSPAIKHLKLIPAILQSADPVLATHLSETQPFFALSATLTLYAHDIQEYSDIARLYDFILAHEPVITIYLFAAIVLQRRSELLDIPLEEPEMLHFTLSKLPQPLDLESLVSASLTLFQEHPPESLPTQTWSSLSDLSVLKTSRNLFAQTSLEKAEKLLRKQAAQLRREAFVKKTIVTVAKHRGPIFSLGAAVFVGVLSIWLRRSGNDRFLWVTLWRLKDHFQASR